MPQRRTFLSFGGPPTAPVPTVAAPPWSSNQASRSGRRARRAAGPPPDAVLMVCTGNICRSAYGQHALQLRLDDRARGRVDVASMGSMPNQQLEVPRPLIALAEARGVHGLERHRPTPLLSTVIPQADLILTATHEHMAAVLREVPRVTSRTFTVLELAELVRRMDGRTDGGWIVPGMGVKAFAREACHHRALARSCGAALDLPDPYGRAPEAYAEMIALMDPALDVIAAALERATAPAALEEDPRTEATGS